MQQKSNMARQDFIIESKKLSDHLTGKIEKRKRSYFRKATIKLRKIVSVKLFKEL